MPNTLIVGNWKMNLDVEASRALALSLTKQCAALKQTEIWLAPSFLNIHAVVEVCRGTPILVGTQNVHWDDKGAFTGEVSPKALRDAGCSFAIVGHSERRLEFGESSELCGRRAIGALEHGIKVVFCVGETLPERKGGLTEIVLTSQLKPLLKALPLEYRELATIAYEPVWAIGTGLAATSTEITETHALIERICREMLDGETIPSLYGGSVTPKNFLSVIQSKFVTGALIGNASLTANKFLAMIEQSENASLVSAEALPLPSRSERRK